MTSGATKDGGETLQNDQQDVASSRDAQPEEEFGPSLHFRVSYQTTWGQQVRVVGEGPTLGNRDPLSGYIMSCRHSGEALVWEARIPMPSPSTLRYMYMVTEESDGVVDEEREVRSVDIFKDMVDAGAVHLNDTWQDAGHPNLLLSRSAFSDVIMGNKTRVDGVPPPHVSCQEGKVVLHLRCWSWALQDKEDVVVLGSCAALGNWEPSKAVALTETTTPQWEAAVLAEVGAFPIFYKYAVRRGEGHLELEEGPDRCVSLEPGLAGSFPAAAAMVQSDGPLREKRPWMGAGVAVPVFSLRSQTSVGAGEFVDIRALVDLCAAAGFRLIQLLPINDTSVYNMWWDSYPYNAISVFALHPLYLCLDALSDTIPDDMKARIAAARKELELPQVDYEATVRTKLSIARQLFDRQDHQLLLTEEYQAWFAENEHWLKPYAVFCFLRDLFGTSEHWNWGALSTPTPEVLNRLTHPGQDHHDSLLFVYYLQYQLHRQLLAVSNYAEGQRVALKGDLPIGVSKQSVDTWTNRGEFHMGFSTGAPPDYFDPNGQNWGFPTYNWEEMKKRGYLWWRARLTHMAQYFHAYRIDHILGFFRIWELPGNCTTGLLGHFRPSIPTTRASLEAQGLWDIDRLVQPWITPSILEGALGDLAEEASARYLVEHLPGRFIFNPAYDSEVKVSQVAARPNSPQWLVDEVERTKKGLLDLMHNVVLLRDAANPDAFTPRISLMDTSSFAELSPHWQNHLRWLHDDYYYHRHNQLWSAQALESLPALMSATDMLVCGEDLGMVPSCVHPVLRRLGLLGLRIQRMPGEADQEFGDPSSYPYLTIASPSCHDTSTTRAWYQEDKERRQRFYSQRLKMKGDAPEACTPEVMATIVTQHLESPSMWVVFPIQDLLALLPVYGQRPAEEETINDPTNPRHYWRFRLHVSLEDLLDDSSYLEKLQALLLGSGRASADDVPSL